MAYLLTRSKRFMMKGRPIFHLQDSFFPKVLINVDLSEMFFVNICNLTGFAPAFFNVFVYTTQQQCLFLTLMLLKRSGLRWFRPIKSSFRIRMHQIARRVRSMNYNKLGKQTKCDRNSLILIYVKNEIVSYPNANYFF